MKWAMEDSVRCAGESSSKQVETEQVLPGRSASPYDSDRTESPEDSDRTESPPAEDDRAASPEELGQSASTNDPPPHEPEHDPLSKRKRLPSRSNSDLSPIHPPKQKRIVEEPVIDLDQEPVPAESTANNDWACEVCTCINPLQFLACDACGVERPQSVLLKSSQAGVRGEPPKRKPASSSRAVSGLARIAESRPSTVRDDSLGWKCQCGAFMEHKWWSCSACGRVKVRS